MCSEPAPPYVYSWENMGKWFNTNAKWAGKYVSENYRPALTWMGNTTQKSLKKAREQLQPFRYQVRVAAQKTVDKTYDAGKYVAENYRPALTWMGQKAKETEMYLGEQVKPGTKWINEKTKPQRKWIDEKINGTMHNIGEKAKDLRGKITEKAGKWVSS